MCFCMHVGRHQAGQRLRMWLAILVLLLVWTLLCHHFLWAHSSSSKLVHNLEDLVDNLMRANNATIASCTLDQLRQAFPPSAMNSNTSNGAACLDLRDGILDIPVHAIVNEPNMPLLGKGNYGVVHKALVRLGNSRNEHCYVAVKTDHCHQLSISFMKRNLLLAKAGYSCLHPDAFLWFKESHLGGEYNGLLLAQAALMMQSSLTTNPLPGWLLPWGIVSLPYDLVSWNPFPRFVPPGIPAPNRRIAGFVFPVLEQGLENNNLRLANAQLTLMESVEALFDALYALVLAHSLGLAHQDIQGKNIAVRQHNNSYSVLLTDNTFLSQRGPCFHSLCSRLCPNLFVQGIRKRRSFPLDMPEMERDVQNFCSQLLLPVLLAGREQHATNQLRSRLETGGAINASHLVQVLQDWRRESQLQVDSTGA